MKLHFAAGKSRLAFGLEQGLSQGLTLWCGCTSMSRGGIIETASCLVMAPASFSAMTNLCTCMCRAVRATPSVALDLLSCKLASIGTWRVSLEQGSHCKMTLSTCKASYAITTSLSLGSRRSCSRLKFMCHASLSGYQAKGRGGSSVSPLICKTNKPQKEKTCSGP